MGSMSRVLNVAILWCDFASKAAVTPNNENVRHDTMIVIMYIGVSIRSGARKRPNPNMMLLLTNPLITPINDFPNTIAEMLTGHMIRLSKHP